MLLGAGHETTANNLALGSTRCSSAPSSSPRCAPEIPLRNDMLIFGVHALPVTWG